MNTIDLSQHTPIETSGHSSKGNQLKWQRDGWWYKADHMGYEGLAEVLVANLLGYAVPKPNYVQYEPAAILYQGREFRGCRCKNFLEEGKEFVPIERLFRRNTGRSLVSDLAKMSDIEERVKYCVDGVVEFTGLQDFGKYLTAALEIDAVFLNEDRHTNNLAVLYDEETQGYSLCPFFDHGLALYADTTIDFPLDATTEECEKRIQAKPFSTSFEDQLFAAEEFYGQQLHFGFTNQDIENELGKLVPIYPVEIIKRVETVLRWQRRKYGYLFF